MLCLIGSALAIVSDSEGEELLTQAKEFYEGVSSNVKELYVFNLERDGSNDHIQLDNRISGNQIMFDWLDNILKPQSQVAKLSLKNSQISLTG